MSKLCTGPSLFSHRVFSLAIIKMPCYYIFIHIYTKELRLWSQEKSASEFCKRPSCSRTFPVVIRKKVAELTKRVASMIRQTKRFLIFLQLLSLGSNFNIAGFCKQVNDEMLKMCKSMPGCGIFFVQDAYSGCGKRKWCNARTISFDKIAILWYTYMIESITMP